MATSRLSDDDKSQICRSVSNTLSRAMYNKKFPIPEDDITEWVTDQMPKAIRKAYRLLKADDSELITSQGYGVDFTIRSDTHKYQIGIAKTAPKNHILIRKKDKYHADVIKWVQWEVDTKRKVDNGTNYIEELVWACTSAGQLKRLLPEEIMMFIPECLLDFSTVERRSRIPASFSPDKDRLEAMMYMLTIGSISPETYKGAKAWSEYSEEIE